MILHRGLLLDFELSLLDRAEVASALETNGCDETLDLWSLGIRLGIRLLLTFDLSSNDILSYVILLAQVKEFPDLGCPLRTQPLW